MSKQVITVSPGLHKLQREFLEQHKLADMLVVDEESGMVVRAEYCAPIWQANRDTLNTFAAIETSTNGDGSKKQGTPDVQK